MKNQSQLIKQLIELVKQLDSNDTMSSEVEPFQVRPPLRGKKKIKAKDFQFLVERRLARIKK